MTTIHISHATRRNNGKFQVFGNYEGADDRFTFGVRSFDDAMKAEEYAERLFFAHEADRIERS